MPFRFKSGSPLLPAGNAEATGGATAPGMPDPNPNFDAQFLSTSCSESEAVFDACEDMDNVGRWGDSTNNYDTRQASVPAQPQFLINQFGSLPGISFDLTPEWTTSGATVGPQVANSGDITIFIVGKDLYDSTNTLTHLGVQQPGGDKKGWAVLSLSDDTVRFSKRGTASNRQTASFALPSAKGVIAIKSTGSAASGITFWFNGVSQTPTIVDDTLGAETTTNTEPLLLGTSATMTAGTNATYGQIRIYESALTDMEIVDVSNYLKEEYSLEEPRAGVTTGLQYWMKKDSGSPAERIFEASNDPAEYGDTVFNWNDSSGNIPAGRITAIVNATYQTNIGGTGYDGMLFSGGSRYSHIPFDPDNTDSFYAYFVLAPSTINANREFLSSFKTTNPFYGIRLAFNSSNNLEMSLRDDSGPPGKQMDWTSTTVDAGSVNELMLVSFYYDGSNVAANGSATLSKNGVALTTVLSGPSAAHTGSMKSQPSLLGNKPTLAAPYSGGLFEAGLFSPAPALADRAAIEAEVKTEFGL